MADGSPATGVVNPLQTEALQRLQDARREKSTINSDLVACYYMAAARRFRQMQSQSQSAPQKPGDDRDLQTSFGYEVVDDFMSMLMETFTPREGWWAERRLPTNPDEEGSEDPDVEELNKLIKAEDKKIFDLIRSSNYYAEKAKAGVPDAAIGVIGLMIEDPGRAAPIRVTGIPIRELDMDLGPDGKPDFRSVTRQTKYRHLAALLGKAVYEKMAITQNEIAVKVKEKPNEPCEVVWAWWRNWENFGDFEYAHVVLVDNKLVHDATLKGEGSLPCVIGRFGATPDFAWPDGPLVKSIADLVQLDEVRGALIENLDFTMRPPKAYEDDGVLNLPVDGVRPGDLHPKRPSGGKSAFEDIYEPRPLEAGLFEVDHLISRIRRMHYVDFPEQRGKTPPTATQWIDELVIRQRRIGTQGYAFWREEPYETFQRFRYLGEKKGVVRPLSSIEGIPSDAALQPYNPAERAQDSQDIATAVRFAEIGMQIAPTMWQVMVDEEKTLTNLQSKFRDEIVALRPQEQVEARIKLLASLGAEVMANGGPQGGGAGGAPPA